jgi:hypothetical protein
VQSSRLDDLPFLCDFYDRANEGGKLGALEGIASRLSFLALEKVAGTSDGRLHNAYFEGEVRRVIADARATGDGDLTEILSELDAVLA